MASFISRIASVFRRSKPQEEEEYSSDALDNEDFEVASKNLGGRGKGAHRTSNNEDVDEEMDEMEIEDRRLEEAERSLAKRKSPNRKKRTSGVEKGEVEVVQDGKDALDEEDYEATTTTKRKRGSDTKNSPTRNPGSTRKKAKIEADVGVEEEELDDANAENRRKSAGTKKTSAGKKNEVVKKRTKVVEELYVEDESKRDSDALDDSDFEVGKGTKKSPKNGVKGKGRPKKEDHEVESDSEEEGERVTVVGKIVEAPTTGRVPPGRISKNTMNFLADLQKPECNDREWFKLHEPVFRQAEKEWVDFIEVLQPLLIEIDPHLPLLPPKEHTHRIYRDVRFSNDKTPYKTNFSATVSRSGRKGIFAKFQPGGGSIVAAGLWAPSKDQTASLRANILRNPEALRSVISSPEFVKLFGQPTPHPKGERRNIFGHDDQLKVAPKGIDKNHKDIDLLKLRTIAVVHKFSDKQVTAPDFKTAVCNVVEVMRPFVHCLNEMVTVQDDDGEE